MKTVLLLCTVASEIVVASATNCDPANCQRTFLSYLKRKLTNVRTKLNDLQEKVNEICDTVEDVQLQVNETVNDIQQQVNETVNCLQLQVNETASGLQQQINVTVSGLQRQVNETVSGLQQQVNEYNEPVAFLAVLEEKRKSVAKDVTIVFDTVITNIGDGYNTSDGQFTAPKSGLYQISATIMANNNGEIWTDILHNGQTVSRVYARASDNEHDQGAHTVLLKLNEGDTVSVKNKVQASTIYGQRYSMFSGALLNFMP